MHSKCDVDQTLDEIWTKKKERLNDVIFITERTEKINGVLWKKAILKEKAYGHNADYTKVVYYTIFNNIAHWIQFNSNSKELDKNIKILNHFIESIKFLNKKKFSYNNHFYQSAEAVAFLE